jgi:putative AlgH/UPF0301 family transcriptional regulator
MPATPVNFTNQFLIAMPGMGDGTFAGTVVYLCEHNEKGALGLVINKPIDIKLKNLFEKVDLSLDREDLAEAPVYFGGPVQTERGFVLHERLGGEGSDGGHYNSSLQIPGGLEMTTSWRRFPTAPGRRRSSSPWATAAGAPGSSKKRWAATAGSTSTPSPASSSTRRWSSATTRPCHCWASTRAC